MSRNSRNLKESIFNSSATAILFPASATKIKTMLSTGEVVLFCRRCRLSGATEAKHSILKSGKRCAGVTRPHDLAYKTTDLFRDTHVSKCSLTGKDAQALCGELGRGRRKAAEIKVRMWPVIGGVWQERAIAGNTASELAMFATSLLQPQAAL